MMTLFHVTKLSALADIEKEGLVATVGPRAKKAGEEIKKVWCYTSLKDLKALAEKDFGSSIDGEKLVAIEFKTSQVRADDMKANDGEDLDNYVFEIGLLKNVLPSELVCSRDLSDDSAPVIKLYHDVQAVDAVSFRNTEELAQRLFSTLQNTAETQPMTYEFCLEVANKLAA